MTRTVAVLGAVVLLGAVPATAQTTNPRFYAGGSAAVDAGSRGLVFGGAVLTAGALFGVQMTDRWSVEVDVDRGFRRTDRSAEAVWISFAPPHSSREEIERLGIRARFDRTQTAGPGVSTHVMWRTREPERVNAGLFVGVSSRRYRSRVVRTTVSVPAELHLPADHPDLRTDDSTRTMIGTGLTGGLIVFLGVTDALTIAPELRYTRGMITDDPYHVFRIGTRVMWRF